MNYANLLSHVSVNAKKVNLVRYDKEKLKKLTFITEEVTEQELRLTTLSPEIEILSSHDSDTSLVVAAEFC